ncbi:hypothetical protein DICPUDRAFT_12282, partial [Dictyostelium purpureum]
ETYNGFFGISHIGETFYKLNDKPNTPEDLVHFLGQSLQKGFFPPGCVVILDNAPLHGYIEIIPALIELFKARGCTLAYLPTYSPKLNPIELYFFYIKRRFYNK